MALSESEELEYLRLLEEDDRVAQRTKLFRLFPEYGPLRRALYPKHMAFFAAGGEHQERCFMAANRVGKTLAGCYEVSCHLVGWYPAWWSGYRFDRAVNVWVSGEDTKSVRESLQVTLCGPLSDLGTGTIPGDDLVGTTARSGVPEALDTAMIRSRFGGVSRLGFKSYDQGRESFQAAKVDVVMFDEEPPMSIYVEGLTRTLSTVPGEKSGIVICTFTPLKGLSDVALAFMPGGERIEGALG